MTTTREALIRAATELLDEGGSDHVTLREVGRRAGVSHNAPYKHFADKEALLASVATQELHETTRLIEQTSKASGLKAALDATIDQALGHPQRFRLVYGPWTHESAELGVAAETTWRALVDAVAHAQADGELPPGDPTKLAELMRVVTHGAVDLALGGHLTKSRHTHGTPEAIVAAHLELLRAAVQTTPRAL